jgi:protocatechuate 3,4-dioxygenase beta subunit
MRVSHREPELENHDRGLDWDLPRLLQRRGLLKLVAGAGLAGTALVTLGACADNGSNTDTAATPGSDGSPAGAPSGGPGGRPATGGGGAPESTETSDTANGELPEETAGPYPGDGSNGANVLTESGVVRSDITTSFGSSTTKAEGVPLRITMTINDFANDRQPMAGAAVYIWHCDRAGQYSLYSQAITNENYLRGVQETDAKGQVTFTSIFPACYSGRWPHIHFEVYPSLAKATDSSNKIATSQMALTEDASKAVSPPPATSRACPAWARSSSTPTTCSATGTTYRSPGSPATPAPGTRWTSPARSRYGRSPGSPQLCSTAARSTGSAATYRWMKASKPATSAGSGSAVWSSVLVNT